MSIHTNPWSSSALRKSSVAAREVSYSLLNFRIEFTPLPLKVLLLSKIIFHKLTLFWQSSFVMSCTLLPELHGMSYYWNITSCGFFWKAVEVALPFPGESSHCTNIICSPSAEPQGPTAPQYFASRELEGNRMWFCVTWCIKEREAESPSHSHGVVFTSAYECNFSASSVCSSTLQTFLGIAMVTKLCQQGLKIFF